MGYIITGRLSSVAFIAALLFIGFTSFAQENKGFNRADTLRGSNGPGRSWWDLLHYDITVEPDYPTQTIKGISIMRIRLLDDVGSTEAQVDLQMPMQMDSVFVDNKLVKMSRDGNAWFIQFPGGKKNQQHIIQCHYSGKPRRAVKAPWDGGWVWTNDPAGNPWMTVACQGLGASVWYPCKDYQADEPDQGAILRMIVPDTLMAVGNGRLIGEISGKTGKKMYSWQVTNPINNYNIVPYIGKYAHFHESYDGEKGKLDMDYWVLLVNLEKAKKQMADAPRMMKAFEHWFGPYPFYADGFKIVEAPHLGMEHQSAIAYGNKYKNGYLGTDLSSTGWGLKWDFIIIHESGHEWFANNITTKDIADMWVHEGFTNYSETLFTDYYYGKEAGNDYVIGTRQLIANDIPIVGIYGVHQEGSGDMYYKAGNMIHMIRQLIGDDETFRKILREMNQRFYHQTVNGSDVESFLEKESGIKLVKIFDQYLRTIQVPNLEYKWKKKKLWYRWTNAVDGFDMPLPIIINSDSSNKTWVYPGTNWKKKKVKGLDPGSMIKADRNFYITLKKID
ncbi:MAG TPA: M1 family metallopeptidase [Ferruginibacter sp.]|nr:M1 family metallopeptidase [Ferruginibacter sp.]